MTISRGQMKRQLYQGGGIMGLSKEGIGGGIIKGVDMGTRTGFFNPFKSAKKIVKKVVGGVKDIASSDVGKMALLAAGAYYTGGALGGTGGFNNFATLGSVLKNKAAGMVPELLKGKTGAALGITALGGIFGGAMAGKSEEEVEALTRDVPALKSYLTQYYTNLNPELRNQPEKVEEFVNSQITEYNEGRGGYAMGGRIGYQDAGPVLPEDPTKPVNPFAPKPTGPVLPDKAEITAEQLAMDLFGKTIEMLTGEQREMLMMMLARSQAQDGGIMNRMNYGMGSDGTMSPDEYFSGKEKYMKQKQMEDMYREYEEYIRDKKMKRDEVAMGGRMKYAMGSEDKVDLQEMLNAEPPFDSSDYFGKAADYKKSPLAIPDDFLKKLIEYFRRNKAGGGIMNRAGYALGGGDTASQNAMQAAGIEGLPMRQNPKGVQELDLRDNGGFIPPVGIKEKEDDIPAMLSNNEFVFTADAVRGMGDGDVELGAQRMYDQMKTLEEGGRV